jgi:hypothetical protein
LLKVSLRLFGSYNARKGGEKTAAAALEKQPNLRNSKFLLAFVPRNGILRTGGFWVVPNIQALYERKFYYGSSGHRS